MHDDRGLYNSSIFLGEKILVQSLKLDSPAGADANPVLNHQVRKILAIN